LIFGQGRIDHAAMGGNVTSGSQLGDAFQRHVAGSLDSPFAILFQ
jgi:hypothetical protein